MAKKWGQNGAVGGEKTLSSFDFFSPFFSFSPFFFTFFSRPFFGSLCVCNFSLCLSASLCAYVSLCVFSESLLFGVSVSLLPFFASFFPFPVCLLPVCVCASLRVSGVGSLHLCIRFFAFYDFMRRLCVFLRLSASLFIYLLFAFFPPFYRLFFCVPCVSALSRSAPLSGATMMMTITSFVRKMAPLEYLAPLSGATMR